MVDRDAAEFFGGSMVSAGMKIVLGVLATLPLLATAGCVVHERRREVIYVEEPPPPRREVITIAPAREDVWIDGHWVRVDRRWEWYGGHWAHRPRYEAVWIPGRYEHRERGYVWIEGHWR
jgi:hypothetical protein